MDKNTPPQRLSADSDQHFFLQGYNSRNEEVNALLQTLDLIAKWPGNLPDDRYTTKTGPNDAALRGHMIVEMRRLAQNTLSKYNKYNNQT